MLLPFLSLLTPHPSPLTRQVLLANTELRPGCRKLFSTLSRHSVPLLVFSAGLGGGLLGWGVHVCVYPVCVLLVLFGM